MMKFTGSVVLRPVRIGFLVDGTDLESVSRAAQLSSCLWGGRYNPIIPFCDTDGSRWHSPYSHIDGLDITRGYVEFFEPDVLIESRPGMAQALGWEEGETFWRMPRVLRQSHFYKVSERGLTEFAAGIDILEVMFALYNAEYQYERRHKRPFATINPAQGDAFFDVVCGRYPADEPLNYIHRTYEDVFTPEILEATAETAIRQIKEGLFGPLWISAHELKESFGRGLRDDTWFIFDPTNAGDVIDYWNFRLVESNVTPVNVNWISHYAASIRERITEVHRPIPGNPFGTKYLTTLYVGSSINDDRITQIINDHLSGLPDCSFVISRISVPNKPSRGPQDWGDRKLCISAQTAHFDEEVPSSGLVRIPAPAPSFLNRSGQYSPSRWINVVASGKAFADETPAIVYPSNLWAPNYPRIATSDRLRVGREGWILRKEHDIGYSLLELQTGRGAVVGWLKTHGIDAEPSEEGQIATQVIKAAGGLMASGMFADRETIELLGEMAEGHAYLSRNGRQVLASTPARSKHINQIQQHFTAREKRSFGYWNALKYFLKRGVFKAGLHVQCPTCGNQNWLDLESISARPTCSRCLNEFEFSQAPEHLQKVKWFYRVIGPFAAPDYARGGYAVALTLRALSSDHDSETTWSTGLKLNQLNCELDFIGWHRRAGTGHAERNEPSLVVGEVKSFGRAAINDEVIATLKNVGSRFPGAIMVASTLRQAGDLSLSEIGRLRKLALWGRRDTKDGQPINPLIILTGTELFSEHNISHSWKKEDGEETHPSYDFSNLHTLAELTQERYLGLPPRWYEPSERHAPPVMTSILEMLATRSGEGG